MPPHAASPGASPVEADRWFGCGTNPGWPLPPPPASVRAAPPTAELGLSPVAYDAAGPPPPDPTASADPSSPARQGPVCGLPPSHGAHCCALFRPEFRGSGQEPGRPRNVSNGAFFCINSQLLNLSLRFRQRSNGYFPSALHGSKLLMKDLLKLFGRGLAGQGRNNLGFAQNEDIAHSGRLFEAVTPSAVIQ